MGRVLAIDYGLRRTGLAVTDPLRIIATPLDMVETPQLMGFLKKYFERETVDELVVGLPKTLSNQPTDITPHVEALGRELEKIFPEKKIVWVDERFTSRIAQQAMVAGGMKKKDRQQKGTVDKVSATLILQTYLHG